MLRRFSSSCCAAADRLAFLKLPKEDPSVGRGVFEDPDRALIRSIIACFRSSTEPGLITLPFESFFSSSTNGSDSPAAESSGFCFGVEVKPGAALIAELEKRLAEGNRVEAGRCGSGRTGMVGMEDRVELSEVDSVGRFETCNDT